MRVSVAVAVVLGNILDPFDAPQSFMPFDPVSSIVFFLLPLLVWNARGCWFVRAPMKDIAQEEIEREDERTEMQVLAP